MEQITKNQEPRTKNTITIRAWYKVVKASKFSALLDFGLFAIITVFLHFFYYHVLGKFLFDTAFFHTTTRYMADGVFKGAVWVINLLFDYNMTTDYLTNTLWLNGNSYIIVSEGCSGFKQDYQLLGLFLLYPGPWKHKLWYIPTTFFVMHLTNILRIVILTIILNYQPENWDFWHEWIMRPFYYVVIFFIWVGWNEWLRKK